MSYSSEVLADTPLAYYRLGEASGTTLVDSSGNGRDGTYNAAPTLGTAGLVGDSDTAATFNGTSHYATVADAAWMDVATITVEAVIKPASVNAVRNIAGRDNGNFTGTNTRYWFLRQTNASGKAQFVFWAAESGPLQTLTGTTTLVVGSEYHIAATYDGSVAKLYVDGVEEASLTISGAIRTDTAVANIFIGRDASSATAYAHGVVDEIAIYGGALSATRIAAHAAARTSATVTLAATLRPKVAAFTLGTVAAITLAGTLQPKSASFVLDAPPDNRTMSLAGTLRPKVADFRLSANGQLSLAGTLQPKAAQFVLTSADRVLLLDGTLRRKSASFTIAALPSVMLAATLQPKIATFILRAVTPVAPAPAEVSEAVSVVVAQAFGPVTVNGTQPVYSISEAGRPRARQQIVVDGVDVTYFRDVVTPDVTYTLLEPLLYGPGQLDLPQVSAAFERPGSGALAWLRPSAPVEVHRVVDDVVVGTDYKGVVVAFDTNGRNLSVELGGEATGRAALRNRQAVLFPRVNDLGHQIADAVRDLGLPHYPALGTVTGIETMTTGGVGHLEHIQNLVAKAWTRGGGHWTVMPDEATGVYETHQKDTTTVHATAFLDDARTVATLRRDISEEPNRVYATTVTPQGQRVRFGVYPGLRQGPVPDFPGHMQSGDTGPGVRLLIGKLHAVGYLRLAEVSGGYDFDVVEAVKDLQDDAGLPQTGEVNLATWEALYDLNVTGTSLEAAHIEPAAQRSVVRRWDRSGSGQIMGFNDDYDPDVLPRDRNVDMGTGLNRSQARRFARAVLHDSNDPNWVGDITFHTGALLRGQVAVGATVTEGDVMDARELRPGMNVWLPQFDGGTPVHVAACQVNGDGIVTASVDTRFRDAMEVWEVIARNKESRNDPARRRNRAHRSSTIQKDSIGEWDEIGGLLGHDVKIERGWNVFEVVAATEGRIGRFRIELEEPAEFVCAVFGREVDPGFLDDVIGNPFTKAGERAWEQREDRLEDHWLLYSVGTNKEPCGYWPGRKRWESTTEEEDNPAYAPDADDNTTGTDDTEKISVTTTETFGTLTGVWKDTAGFDYRSWDRTKVYVVVYAKKPNTIPLGRIMWPQLEAGV